MTDFIVKIYTLYRMKTENDLKIIDFLAKSYLCEGLSEHQIEELSSFAIMIYLKEMKCFLMKAIERVSFCRRYWQIKSTCH